MNLLHNPIVDLDRPRRSVAALSGLAAVAVIAAAWSFEAMGFIPCKLCLIQREPYYLAMPLAAMAFGVEAIEGPGWLTRIVLLVLIGLFVWGGAVGFYQAGAEWGYWPGPSDCGAGRAGALSARAGDLLGNLSKVKIVDCTRPQIRIFGLSFAGWNVITSTGLVLFTLVGAVLPNRARSR